MTGRVHSLESFGTVDGPGVRFVVFLQGCELRCGCCHNPDTWDRRDGKEYTVSEVMEKVTRCREYFGKEGGITVSGGEPLLQPEFTKTLFDASHGCGINTCLDTSGCILTPKVRELLLSTDRVLLDLKYTSDADYRSCVGVSLTPVLNFLDCLEEMNIPTTLRQVIIPTKNDTEENVLELARIANAHPTVTKVELLPFKKICQVKYDGMGIPFPFGDLPTPTASEMKRLNDILKSNLNIDLI